jgi:hypothetical protein
MKRKLTTEDVAMIRELIDHRKELARQYSALTDRALAEKFGVHHRTIEKRWAH